MLVEGIFWLFSGVAILSAFLCITRRSPVASALWLVITLFSLAGLFVLLDAQFVAVVQVIAYAGAIMVLFLFVIMLLNLGRDGPGDMKGWPGRIVALVLGALVVGPLLVLRNILPDERLRMGEGEMARLTEEMGAVHVVAEPLFRDYLVPLQITGLLLLAAIMGAVVLAKRKL